MEETLSREDCEELQPIGRAQGKVNGGFSPMGGSKHWKSDKNVIVSCHARSYYLIWLILHQDDGEILA